jgi:A118 family predicted phage portal protein
VTNGRGCVYHALYQGTETHLGKRISLMDHTETRHIAELVDAEGEIETGATRLAVAYWPNVRPNRQLRGSPLGRSHYQGALSAMDGLDATWSSWMRDLDLAKARLIVPDGYLRGLGVGQGATFNVDQQVFVGVRSADPNAPLQIQMTQFAIRVEEHERTAAAHWRTIVRAAGLSADAFGEESSGAQATATEVGQRGARTVATRGKEISYARPALRHICEVLLELDAVHFGTAGVPRGGDLQVRVEFPDGVSADIEKQARTVQLLDAAAAVSLRTKISMAHPDWDDDQIEAEAKAIEGEKEPVVVTDPDTFTGDEQAGATDEPQDLADVEV